MSKLRKKSFLYMLPIVLLLGAVAFSFGQDALKILRPHFVETTDINDIVFTDGMKELYVSGKVHEIGQCYVEIKDGFTTKAWEYIMKTPDGHYIGLRLKSRYSEEAALAVVGTLKRMPADSQFAYNDALDYLILSDEEKGMVLHYYIEYAAIDDELIIYCVSALVCLVIAVVLFGYVVTGRCHKDINSYIASCPVKASATERVESFLNNAPYLYNLQYDNEFVCNRRGISTIFFETRKVVRIYKETEIHKFKMLIPIFKSCELVFVLQNG